jgi:magnesium chelatase family protein
VPGLEVVAVRTLADAVGVARGESLPATPPPSPTVDATSTPLLDLADIRGQEFGRVALEVAAAGGHHLSLSGPPGVGKTLLAQALPGILPPLTDDEAVDVAAIHSVAGLERDPWTSPPLRCPHHSVSTAAMLGSVRRGAVVPGEVTLAHRGVLVLDEAAELARPSLEGLRQPLESGTIALHRAGWAGILPAAFQLVLAANPCPCGAADQCTCPSSAIRRYAARISGPLLDRVDLRVAVRRPAAAVLGSARSAESSAAVRDRVCAARERCRRRGVPRNADIPAVRLRREFLPAVEGAELLASAERNGLSPRGLDRVLRVSWTLADLGGRDRPGRDDVALALALREPAGSIA